MNDLFLFYYSMRAFCGMQPYGMTPTFLHVLYVEKWRCRHGSGRMIHHDDSKAQLTGSSPTITWYRFWTADFRFSFGFDFVQECHCDLLKPWSLLRTGAGAIGAGGLRSLSSYSVLREEGQVISADHPKSRPPIGHCTRKSRRSRSPKSEPYKQTMNQWSYIHTSAPLEFSVKAFKKG